MKTLHTDLFPETLLVDRDGDRVFTTSLKMAEHFNRRHQYVMNVTKNIVDELKSDGQFFGRQIEFSQLNFQPSEYTNERGKTYPMFKFTEEGFALVAMSFTGREALAWKVKFLAAFRDMERRLISQKEREANALYGIRPKWKAIVEHPDLRRQQLIVLTGHKSTGSITACRHRMRKVGLLD
ncbi:MAG TPA: Rha family transcriptional regulator [Azonexus sp.]|nr:Rha family transcriptional regulator [Azonexus sp.]